MSDRPGLFDFAAHKARNRALWESVGWDEIAAFIGPSAERFHAVWAASREKNVDGRGGLAMGFCVPAFLFGFAWFFYRKMWALGAVMLVLPIAFGMFLDTPGPFIGFAVAMAMVGKGLYVQHALGRIDDLRAKGGGEEALRAAGGVSLPGGAVGALILAAAAFASWYTILGPGR